MNIGDVKNAAIALIAQYSNGGQLVPNADNADYLLRANIFINQAQKEVATIAKIHTKYQFTQNAIEPLNGSDYGFNMVQYLPTGSDLTDIGGVNGRAYYFEVDNSCTVYVEESSDNTNWSNLSTVTVTGTGIFVAYKGLITPTLTTNSVRLRFTGTYPFNRRNSAMWNVPFANTNSIPTYAPYVRYELPSDFMELSKTINETDVQSYLNMYGIRQEGRKTFLVPYYSTGSFAIEYYKIPTDITSSTPDNTELEVYNGMPQNTVAYYVAAHMIMDEYPSLGQFLMSEYQQKLSNLKTTDSSGVELPYNVSGW